MKHKFIMRSLGRTAPGGKMRIRVSSASTLRSLTAASDASADLKKFNSHRGRILADD
ncbi:hypothetical protein [Paraburkholderia sp. J67]|uniref:hypothetical protein n=1 Tax=Paraburkholderia sp. J67 TaxID=2805435 RepID=UPI002ABE5FC2|nr:hypothetical protein [Paraburkholderia sp. J67]